MPKSQCYSTKTISSPPISRMAGTSKILRTRLIKTSLSKIRMKRCTNYQRRCKMPRKSNILKDGSIKTTLTLTRKESLLPILKRK